VAEKQISRGVAEEAVSGHALGIAATVATVTPIALVTLGFSLAFDSLLPRPQDMPLLIGFAIAGVLVAALTVCLLVLPLHWLLGRTGVRGGVRVLISGTMGAVPASALWLLLQMLSNDPLSRALVAFWPLTILAPGLLGAGVYCIANESKGSQLSPIRVDRGHPRAPRYSAAMHCGNELRASWRARWLAAIREIADLREQRATWLNPEAENPHYTFIECMCCYFDELRLNRDESYWARVEEGLLTIDEVAAVKPLHSMLSAYSAPTGDDCDHQAILSDPHGGLSLKRRSGRLAGCAISCASLANWRRSRISASKRYMQAEMRELPKRARPQWIDFPHWTATRPTCNPHSQSGRFRLRLRVETRP